MGRREEDAGRERDSEGEREERRGEGGGPAEQKGRRERSEREAAGENEEWRRRRRRGDRVGCRKHADTRNHIHACIYA